jgi:hypothetical protein
VSIKVDMPPATSPPPPSKATQVNTFMGTVSGVSTVRVQVVGYFLV